MRYTIYRGTRFVKVVEADFFWVENRKNIFVFCTNAGEIVDTFPVRADVRIAEK